jgi:glutathione S-transferase
MSITLYEMAHSPYCIPITQALTALGQPFDRVAIPNWDRSEIIRLTNGAYYQVPVLKHQDKVVFESTNQSLDVALYIDAQFASGRLFPEETKGLQEILVGYIENDLEGLTFKLCDINDIPSIVDLVERTMSVRHKERSFGRGCIERWTQEKDSLKAQLDAMLERFNGTLKHRPFLFGAEPRYVDFALYGVIGNYTYRDYNQVSPRHEALQDWVTRLRDFRF